MTGGATPRGWRAEGGFRVATAEAAEPVPFPTLAVAAAAARREFLAGRLDPRRRDDRPGDWNSPIVPFTRARGADQPTDADADALATARSRP
jgi:hypothetical protein